MEKKAEKQRRRRSVSAVCYDGYRERAQDGKEGEAQMGLYDIMDEIAARQVTKSETGDNRMQGVALGIVTANYADRVPGQMPGRVCVEIPVRDADANELKWARVAMAASGKSWGHFFLPEVGDQVLLAFENGNIERPYVIGCISQDSNKFLTDSVDRDNRYKRIVTKNGNTLQFEDVAPGEGDRDKISLFTSGEKHRLIMDNEKGNILLEDEKGNNGVEICSNTGNIRIKTEHKLTVTVGDSIELSMNGDTGTVSLKCNKLKAEAARSAGLSANGKVSISGGNVSMDATASFKLTSSGMTSLGGSPVKIG